MAVSMHDLQLASQPKGCDSPLSDGMLELLITGGVLLLQGSIHDLGGLLLLSLQPLQHALLLLLVGLGQGLALLLQLPRQLICACLLAGKLLLSLLHLLLQLLCMAKQPNKSESRAAVERRGDRKCIGESPMFLCCCLNQLCMYACQPVTNRLDAGWGS